MQASVVREGTEQDRDSILQLRREVFGGMEADKLDARFWKWQFLDGPDGPAVIDLVENAGSVVGHFAHVPRRFSRNGQPLSGSLSIDLMVHPNHRRKGLFREMGRHAEARTRRQGSEFLFAFPIRPETIRGLRTLGWKVVEELPVLVRPLRFRRIAERFVPFPPVSAIAGGMARLGYDLLPRPGERAPQGELRCEPVTEFDDRFDSFWRSAVTSSPMVGNRTRAFLRWRYLDHPTRSYGIHRTMRGGEMTGFVVLRTATLLRFHTTVVVDLMALDEESVRCLLRHAVACGQREKSDLVGLMVPRTHEYHRIARTMGFLPSTKKFLLMVNPQKPESDLVGATRWYVNWGDTDVM